MVSLYCSIHSHIGPNPQNSLELMKHMAMVLQVLQNLQT